MRDQAAVVAALVQQKSFCWASFKLRNGRLSLEIIGDVVYFCSANVLVIKFMSDRTTSIDIKRLFALPSEAGVPAVFARITGASELAVGI